MLLFVVLVGCSSKKGGIRPDNTTEWEKDQAIGQGNIDGTCDCIDIRF